MTVLRRVVTFEPTAAAWREAARALLAAEVPPDAVTWRERGEAQLELGGEAPTEGGAAPVEGDLPRADDATRALAVTRSAGADAMLMSGGGPRAHRVPRRFVELLDTVAAHADARRWAVLYRVLWRLTHGEPRLLDVAVDDAVHRLLRLDKAVRREIHKVHAFVRFRRVAPADGDAVEHFVAWLATDHDCLPLAAPFFARRFPNMRWSILGPRRSAHWDGATLALGPGVPRDEAPAGDALERLWRTYYASIFNPARVRPAAMRAEMPRRYWHALPEAQIVADLVADAPARVRRMLEAEMRPPAAVSGAARRRARRDG